VSEEGTGLPQEDSRLCPTCRMPVSVLATRCRHCGESLGRPRKAEEKFTIEDLGGEARGEYTVSGDLMDAMESFRLEMTGADAAKNQPDRSSRWFARESKGTGEHKSHFSELELPSGNLDDLANANISYTTPPPRPSSNITRSSQKSNNKLYFIIGGVVVLVVVALLFMGPLKSVISPPPPEVVVRENRALQMLAAGQPILDVMKEARAALDANITDENKQIQAQVREKFSAQIRDILNAKAFAKAPLEDALRLTQGAAEYDSDASIQALLDQVNKDLNYHRFLLMSIDTAAGTATFELNNPQNPEKQQVVKEGDLLQGRFKVERITSELVRLSDQEIDVLGGKRRLVSRMFKGVVGD